MIMKLIDKDALVAEIKKLIRENELYLSENASDAVRFQKTGAYSILNDLLHSLDTLEVKEADLEKEMSKYLGDDWKKDADGKIENDMIAFAKHFFELGLSSQLSWQDVKRLSEIGETFMNSEESDNLSEEEYYTEILNKFKAQKGEKV